MNDSMRRLWTDTAGVALVETSFIAFLLVILPFAVVELGLAWWQWNAAEKATQLGVQLAAVSDPIASELATFTCGNSTVLPGTSCSAAGASTFGTITCSGQSSSCDGGYSFDATSFGRLVAKMQIAFPNITSSNVTVQYRDVGLGFAGRTRPIPLISVRLVNMTFSFIALSGLIPGPINMPAFTATLPAEDLTTAGAS